jgi:hypothetical protein
MEKFYLFLNGIILLFLTTLPILILFIGIKSTIKMKGQNKPIWLIIVIAAIYAIFFIISSLPIAYLLISKDVFGYFMILIIQYYALSVFVPCLVPALLSYILIKKRKIISSKLKILMTVLIISTSVMVCVGVFTGFFFDIADKIKG